MSKQTLKSIAQRGVTLGAAFAVVAASLVQAVPAYADALNPLTERSLTLSSSSPGWSYTDGSGNTTYAPPNSGANGQKTGNYFDFKVSSSDTVKSLSFQYCTTSAGSCIVPGNNSPRGATPTATTSDLHVQFPSAAEVANVAGAGTITVTNGSATVTGAGTSFLTTVRPGTVITTDGNESYTVASVASNTSLTLTANAAGATETGVTYDINGFGTVINSATGAVKAVPGYTNNNPKYIAGALNNDPAEAAKGITGNFIVMYKSGGVWVQDTGWTASAHKVTTDVTADSNNYIVVTKTAGVALTSGQQVKVLFFANATNYITNPGNGEYYVKINTYNVPFKAVSPTPPEVDLSGLAPAGPNANIIDGGVTVANVMNQSIQITTKVLETMEFSVGTVDPTTLTGAELLASDRGNATHQPCDLILQRLENDPAHARNVLQLGDQAAESSLKTSKAYATHSYWRLSSNSSGGATVYYSGHTLTNTSGDEIKAIGTTPQVSSTGGEQFGLAISAVALAGDFNFNTGTYGVSYAQDTSYENAADNGKLGVHKSTLGDLGATHVDFANAAAVVDTTDTDWNFAQPPLNASYHTPRLDPLAPVGGYGNGYGKINSDSHVSMGGGNAQFAFNTMSDTVPEPIATQNTQVVDCVTAKMRYVANIAATTPAGIYTTKINYIAAPQY